MARKYSGKKGKSGSKKPTSKEVPSWMTHSEKEIEKLVVKLGKTGLPAAQIGLQLRDSYGIPDVKVATKKSISKILTDNNLSKKLPDDLMDLVKRSITLRKHLEENHKDNTAKRGLELTDSKLRKLMKYYKRSSRISKDWKFDPKAVRLQVE